MKEFENIVPIIVPIFDGINAMSASMREWFELNFPNTLNDLEDDQSDVYVRAVSSKWWYTGDSDKDDLDPTTETVLDKITPIFKEPIIYDSLSENESWSLEELKDQENDQTSLLEEAQRAVTSYIESDSKVLKFHIVAMLKKRNHRKHNSHQWFFCGMMDGLGETCKYTFLTDCGTGYDLDCLAQLTRTLLVRTDLIGVTARQRIELPSEHFNPCDDAYFSCFRGDHSKLGLKPCWKCYLCFACSPAPLQAFEFEASSALNWAMFNLVEALPVLPGPCQLLDWPRMKKFRVYEDYFNLLMKSESESSSTTRILPLVYSKIRASTNSLSAMNTPRSALNTPRSPRERTPSKDVSTDVREAELVSMSVKSADDVPSPRLDLQCLKHLREQSILRDSGSQSSEAVAPASITIIEFIRVNMRLAEDRILSFVVVFSTGFGTMWNSDATFIYRPEVTWETLLKQRRRWTNGTFASYLFVFLSKRARTRVFSSTFHTNSKNVRLISALWSVQIYEMCLVLLSPAIFATCSTIGVAKSALIVPQFFAWADMEIYITPSLQLYGTDLWLGTFMMLYVYWVFKSFYVKSGRMPEVLCSLYVVFGFLFVFPVYFSIFAYVSQRGFDALSTIALTFTIILPVLISFAYNYQSGFILIMSLPWFIFCLVFFVVFMPAYSFARLWDTTWGNRNTGIDSALNANTEYELKRYTLYANIGLVALNVLGTIALIKLFAAGYDVQLGFMIVIFVPIIIQVSSSFFYFFMLTPFMALRRYIARIWPFPSVGTDDAQSLKSLDTKFTENTSNSFHTGIVEEVKEGDRDWLLRK